MNLTDYPMKYLQGEILTEDGFITGYLGFTQDGEEIEVHRGTPPEIPVAKGIIIPTLFNGHTHIGDSFIRGRQQVLPRSVHDLVAPPIGLKHRLLKEATEQEITKGMEHCLEEMTVSGTSGFCDFREGGLIGVFQLKKAMKNKRIDAVVLARPCHSTYEKGELERILENADGIGLSSVSDWEPSEIEKIARHVHRKKKIFALHASEVDREDIDRILDLRPNLLVHMIAATSADLERVRDANIPIVVCPRSYLFFGLKHNFALMKKTQVTLMLGSDNAMINSPDVLKEVRLLHKTGIFSLEDLLTAITYTPRKALNLDDCIQAGNLSRRVIVLKKVSLKQLYVSK
jgi:cytosine/adenosine deaminase-related metal-dependent hydrolase